MQTKISGILLNKNIFKDKDILANLLLRNGEKVSVVFYGGKGGGKKNKPSTLEYGHLLNIELDHKVKNDIYTAKEWNIEWRPEKIRYDYKAYLVLSFFLEMTEKMATSANLTLKFELTLHHEGLFRVLSNALFFLEESLAKNDFIPSEHLNLFLMKLIFELGIMPDLFHCMLCGEELKTDNIKNFDINGGGFCCQKCNSEKLTPTNLERMDEQNSLEHWSYYHLAKGLKYAEYKKINGISYPSFEKNILYLTYHLNVDIKSIKTLSMLKGL